MRGKTWSDEIWLLVPLSLTWRRSDRQCTTSERCHFSGVSYPAQRWRHNTMTHTLRYQQEFSFLSMYVRPDQCVEQFMQLFPSYIIVRPPFIWKEFDWAEQVRTAVSNFCQLCVWKQAFVELLMWLITFCICQTLLMRFCIDQLFFYLGKGRPSVQGYICQVTKHIYLKSQFCTIFSCDFMFDFFADEGDIE